MASKDNNKSQKSKHSTAAGQGGKQSTPLTQTINSSEVRISIQEYTPDLAATSSSSAISGSNRKKEKAMTSARKESNTTSASFSSSSIVPTSSTLQQQGTSSSSIIDAVGHNTPMDETVDVDYNEDEDDVAVDDQGHFGRPEFADVAFDRMRDQVGSPVSDVTDNYGYDDDPVSVKQAAKADAMKDARHQRRQCQKQRLKDLTDRGLIDHEAHKLLNWEQLAEVYLSERDKYVKTKELAAEAKEEARKASDDRNTALRQLKEHKLLVQVEHDKLKRLKDQHLKDLAAAVDAATTARENVFALQNKKLDAAEREKAELQKKHLDEIASLEAKHADSSTQQAYDAATIRTLKAERDQMALDYNDLILLKDRLRSELLDLRSGGTGTLNTQDLANDPHKQLTLFQNTGTVGGF